MSTAAASSSAMSVPKASASEQGASTASVAGFSLFSHGGFPPGRGTYRNAPTYAEAAVALELSESIEKLLLDDFDDEC